MKIKVTQEHINKGVARNCSTCPTGLALKEATGDEAYVYPFGIYIHKKKRSYPTPPEVLIFIDIFDNPTSRHLAQPFEIELPI